VIFLFHCPNQKSLKTALNVILILTMIRAFGDLSNHGNDSINTASLGSIGMESARFDRFYVSPLCAPREQVFKQVRYIGRTGTVSSFEWLGGPWNAAAEYTWQNFLKTTTTNRNLWQVATNVAALSQFIHSLRGLIGILPAFKLVHWSQLFRYGMWKKNGKVYEAEGLPPEC